MPIVIHQLKLGPSNAYLIATPSGAILVDTSTQRYANRILKTIQTLNAGPLRLIYITHAHVDHYCGASAIRAATGAPIAVHELDAEAMERGETHLGSVRNWRWTASIMPWIEQHLHCAPAKPDILLGDADSLEVCGIEGKVLWTPGHTPGSSSLMLQLNGANHIFVGDLISNTGSPHLQSSYAQEWEMILPSTLKSLAFRSDYYYPGHGPAPVPVAAVQALVQQ